MLFNWKISFNTYSRLNIHFPSANEAIVSTTEIWFLHVINNSNYRYSLHVVVDHDIHRLSYGAGCRIYTYDGDGVRTHPVIVIRRVWADAADIRDAVRVVVRIHARGCRSERHRLPRVARGPHGGAACGAIKIRRGIITTRAGRCIRLFRSAVGVAATVAWYAHKVLQAKRFQRLR